MTVINMFGKKPEGPGGSLKCEPCRGKGKRASRCDTCANRGIVHPNEARYFACPDCDNMRCRSCGGDGIAPTPRTYPIIDGDEAPV